MSWLAWTVLGGLAGWIASMLTRNNAQIGLFANIIVGMIGALVGSFILGALGVTDPLTFNITALFIAVGGAVVLLFLVSLTTVQAEHN